MRPALGGMYQLGGSHAQQDVLEQLFLDAALKADSAGDVRLLLERVSGRHPVPPSRASATPPRRRATRIKFQRAVPRKVAQGRCRQKINPASFAPR